jgi:hypothetical protein
MSCQYYIREKNKEKLVRDSSSIHCGHLPPQEKAHCDDFKTTVKGCTMAPKKVACAVKATTQKTNWLVLKSAFLSRFYIIILHLKYQ